MVSAPLPLLAITNISGQLTQLQTQIAGQPGMPVGDLPTDLPIGKILDAIVTPRDPLNPQSPVNRPGAGGSETVRLSLPQGTITLKPPPQLQQFLQPNTPVEVKLERTPQGLAARLVSVASVPVEKLMEATTSKGTPPAIITPGEVEIPLPTTTTALPYNKLKPPVPLDMPLPGGVKPVLVAPAQLMEADAPQQQAWQKFVEQMPVMQASLPAAATAQPRLPAVLSPGMQLLMRVFFVPAPTMPASSSPAMATMPVQSGQTTAMPTVQAPLPGGAQPGMPAPPAMAAPLMPSLPGMPQSTLPTVPQLGTAAALPFAPAPGQATISPGMQPATQPAAVPGQVVATATPLPAAPVAAQSGSPLPAANAVPATTPAMAAVPNPMTGTASPAGMPPAPSFAATPSLPPNLWPVTPVATPSVAGTPVPTQAAATAALPNSSMATPVGTWQTMPLPAPPPGMGLAVEFMPLPNAVSLQPSLPLPQDGNVRWPALQEAVQLLQKLESPVSNHFIQQRLPQIGAKLLPASLFFLQALNGKGTDDWPGEEVMKILQHSSPELATKLTRDVHTLQQQWQQSADQPWQSAMMPMWFQDEIEPVSMYFRKQSKKAENGMEGHRFMVDLNLSHFGPMQLDGFYKQWAQGVELPNTESSRKQFSLTIRTQRPLESDVGEGIRHLFYTSMEAMRLQGNLSIRHDEPFVIAESPPGGLFSVLKAFSG
ncbi:hypothetical protein GC177_01440 [bacterium]|nr:hypothetical protein [bacterium]